MRTSIDKPYLISRMKDVTYFVLPDTTCTICNITMVNGYGVRGESACVDPRNFEASVGREIAYENAFQKLWALEGYLLAERLHEVSRGDVNHDIGWAVQQAKNGKRVTRTGWNAKGQWIAFSPGSLVDYTAFWAPANKQYAKEQPGSCAEVFSAMTLKNAQGQIVMGWVPSPTDLLMQDWEVVE